MKKNKIVNVLDKNSELKPEFQKLVLEILNSKEIKPKDDLELLSETGNLSIKNCSNDEVFLINEKFPKGNFDFYFVNDYSFAFIKFRNNCSISEWRKAELSRVFYGYNVFPNGFAIMVNKETIITQSDSVDVNDMEKFLSDKIAHDAFYCSRTDESSYIKGTFFPFIGYDENKEVVALIIYHEKDFPKKTDVK